jgi:hypothetical protein
VDGVEIAGSQWQTLLTAADEVKEEARRRLDSLVQVELDKMRPRLEERFTREVLGDICMEGARKDWNAFLWGSPK